MEIGHPTHIFDHDKLKRKEIHVRRAKKNESITTLDDNKHKVDAHHLLITDGKEPIALAGIMGGLDCAVDNDTKTILIESAYFNSVAIRKSSKSLSLSTEASKRFERGADPNAAISAFWRVINLIEEYAGGRFNGDFTDFYPEELSVNSIKIRKDEIELIIGVNIEDDQIIYILEGLGFSVTKNTNDFDCIPPTFRPDVTREIDIIEEIARIYGYDNIPIDNTLFGTYSFKETDPQSYLQSIINTFSGLGFHQIYSNSLQNKEIANLYKNNSVPMMNPLSNDMAFLRTSLIPGLVKAAEHNINNSSNSFKLFELGSVHTQTGNKIDDIDESVRLSGIIFGDEYDKSIHADKTSYNIFSLKGYLYTLLNEKLHYSLSIKETQNKFFDRAYNIIIENESIGTFGKLSGNLFSSLKIDRFDIYCFDIDMDMIINNSKTIRYLPINLFPKISRRINLVMECSDSVGPIQEVIKKKGGKILISVSPVEIFEDEKNIGENKKSITYEMVFQDREKTLEDKDVNPIIDEIIDIAKKNFNAKLRV